LRPAVRPITEHSAEIGGHLVAWRAAEGEEADPPRAPILWLHGVPDSSSLWTPFLAEAGGIAPDLPGFGRSGKRADFPYSIDGYARFLETFCDHLGLERIRLVVHDWGAVGLAMAARRPGLVERIVAIDPVPFVEGFRWHWVARVWRTRGLGELAMGLTIPAVARRVARGMPREALEDALANLDHGTQRAILRLYRSADPAVLAAAGRELHRIDAPALILWGEDDPFVSSRYAKELGNRLAECSIEIRSDCGHWPWGDHAEVFSRILRVIQA
jgi:pimeloyl-ACP methyl ester carboxylesterase